MTVVEEAFGYDAFKLNLPGRFRRERETPPFVIGLGEPGVKRSMPAQM